MTDTERRALETLPPDVRVMVATGLGPFAHHVEQRLAREILRLAVAALPPTAPVLPYGGWETS